MRRAWAALALGSAVVATVLALTLGESRIHLASSNHVPEFFFVASLPHGGELCQRDERIPPDARRLRLLIGTEGETLPELEAAARDGGARTVIGRLPAGAREGVVEVPLASYDFSAGTELCLRSGGDGRGAVCVRGRLRKCGVIAGNRGLSGGAARLGNRPEAGRIRVEYLRPGRESWAALTPEVNERFALAKARFLGPWLFPLTVILVVAACALAIGQLWRGSRA